MRCNGADSPALRPWSQPEPQAGNESQTRGSGACSRSDLNNSLLAPGTWTSLPNCASGLTFLYQTARVPNCLQSQVSSQGASELTDLHVFRWQWEKPFSFPFLSAQHLTSELMIWIQH